MDNLADAQSLTEIEQEKEDEKERTRSIRRSKSKTPEKDGQVSSSALYAAPDGCFVHREFGAWLQDPPLSSQAFSLTNVRYCAGCGMNYQIRHHYCGSQCCYYCFICSPLACRLARTVYKIRQVPKLPSSVFKCFQLASFDGN